MAIPTPTDKTLTAEDLILQTDARGAPVRLEWVRGRLKGEASPASRHQLTLRAIERSITPLSEQETECACSAVADVLIRFPDPDRSLKRPDLAIFCEDPPAVDTALDMVPAAVIEVLSLGYEEKDLGQDGAAFYLACGVDDVLVVDPRAGLTLHYRRGQPEATQHPTPSMITLGCGCQLWV